MQKFKGLRYYLFIHVILFFVLVVQAYLKGEYSDAALMVQLKSEANVQHSQTKEARLPLQKQESISKSSRRSIHL